MYSDLVSPLFISPSCVSLCDSACSHLGVGFGSGAWSTHMLPWGRIAQAVFLPQQSLFLVQFPSIGLQVVRPAVTEIIDATATIAVRKKKRMVFFQDVRHSNNVLEVVVM